MRKFVVRTAAIGAVSAGLLGLAVPANAAEMSADDRSQILALHNQYRQEAGQAQLQWDDTLARGAQQWAEQIQASGEFKHDKNRGFVGENISGTYDGAAGAARNWYQEKSAYDSDPNKVSEQNPPDGTNWKKWGHYSQMVWSNTTKVGCGLAAPGKLPYSVVVCRYEAPGNMTGQKAF